MHNLRGPPDSIRLPLRPVAHRPDSQELLKDRHSDRFHELNVRAIPNRPDDYTS